MQGFEFSGVRYRSQREFCIKNKVSYDTFKRLRRTYQRAKKDILIAVKWILGIELKPKSEQKTSLGYRDRDLARYRKIAYKKKQKEKVLSRVYEIIKSNAI